MLIRVRNPMIILGIDPGTTRIGFAFLDAAYPTPRLLKAGLLPMAHKKREDRLLDIHTSLTRLITDWNPGAIGVEKLFFDKNQKTAMAVAEARGIILLTAAIQKITLFEYTPLEVKQAVTGHGGAKKSAVEKIIRMSVPGARELDAKDDVFDAIGIALTTHLLNRLHPTRTSTQKQ